MKAVFGEYLINFDNSAPILQRTTMLYPDNIRGYKMPTKTIQLHQHLRPRINLSLQHEDSSLILVYKHAHLSRSSDANEQYEKVSI